MVNLGNAFRKFFGEIQDEAAKTNTTLEEVEILACVRLSTSTEVVGVCGITSLNDLRSKKEITIDMLSDIISSGHISIEEIQQRIAKKNISSTRASGVLRDKSVETTDTIVNKVVSDFLTLRKIITDKNVSEEDLKNMVTKLSESTEPSNIETTNKRLKESKDVQDDNKSSSINDIWNT